MQALTATGAICADASSAPAKPAAAAHFGVLESWRGVCALLVAFFHLAVASHVYFWPVFRHGGEGVTFFFVLSGFVMAHAYGRKLDHPGAAKRFVVRRFWRLYPLHLATLAVLVAIEGAKALLVYRLHISAGDAPFTGPSSLPALAGNLLLVNGIGVFRDFTWNGASWSISTEFWTYLLFLAVGMAPLALEGVLASALIVGAGGALLAITWLHLPVTTAGGGGFLSCIECFFLGTLVQRLHASGRFGWLRSRANLAEIAVVALVIAAFCGAFPPETGLAPFVFALTVLVFAGSGGVVSRALDTRVPRYLGRISYSIYLMQGILLAVLNGGARVLQAKLHRPLHARFGDVELIAFGGPWAMDALALAFLLALVAAGSLAYVQVEDRFRRR